MGSPHLVGGGSITAELWESLSTCTQSIDRLQLLLLTIDSRREFIEMCDSACFASENQRLMHDPGRKFCGLEKEKKKISYTQVTFPPNCCVEHKTN